MVIGTSKPELESSELEVVNSEVGAGFIYTPKLNMLSVQEIVEQ